MHSLNKIYRTIWSEALNAWVAVSELVKSKGKRSCSSLMRTLDIAGVHDETDDLHRHRFKLATLSALCLLSFGAQANPMGGQVVSGSASFNTSGNTLTVTNTPGAIIHWQDFSIQQNEITRFAQQSASSAVLNRVVGGNTSQILGSLQSNGRVFLVNPNGIVFGQGATVDVAGLVATSLNLSDADFLAGRNRFSSDPNAQAVSNAGNLTAQQGGEIWLIAPDVQNTGIINAPNGEILLAAGSSVELVNSLDPNLRVTITAPAGDATNVGQLVASAGRLGLFGTVVRNSGQVSADSATLQGGKIVFRSSQRTEITGTASAQGIGGGEIKVLSDMKTGTVSVSGTLDASAPVSGNGGFIETSAARVNLAPTTSISAGVKNGQGGQWLIDPADVFINTATQVGGTFTAGGTWLPSSTPSYISTGTIQGALNLGTNVTITTVNAGLTGVGDINVQASIAKTAGTAATLTLLAENNINFANGVGVSSSSGALNLVLHADSDGSGVGTVTFAGLNTFSLLGGRADLYYNPVSYTDAATKSDALTNPYSAVFGATPHTAWMLVNDVGLEVGGTLGLQAMNTNLSGNYALGKNFTAATSLWNAGAGFVPVGTIATPFTGRFDGMGHTIDGLTINRSGDAGLFGFTNASTIKNVTLTTVNITGSGYVGGLVGRHQGGLSNSHVASGTVTSTGVVSTAAGGLVGLNYNYSTIDSSSAGSTVSGTSYVGGLIGASQQSTLTNVSATGNVTGTNWGAGGLVGSMEGDFSSHTLTNGTASGNVSGSSYVGGLVGWNGYLSSITNGIASGTVTSTLTVAGGLVGMNAYNITGSHATGNVTGVTNVGGLVGNNSFDNNPSFLYTYGSISNSDATTGTVTGTTNVGGLAGQNCVNCSITASFAGGGVSGNSNVGGLVGNNDRGSISITYATGTVAGNGLGSTSLGGLVGNNSGTITNSYAAGASVSGVNNVGGLVGYNWLFSGYTNDISGSYVSAGAVTGTSNVGGLVGYNTGTLTNSHFDINGVTVNGANVVTLGGLYNDNTASFNGVGQYTDWLVNGNKSLNIANYTSPYGSFGNGGTNIYTIGTAQGLKDMLGFADNSTYTFTLTANVDLTGNSGLYIPVLAGAFDGAGSSVSNLNLNLPNQNMGLVGYASSTATISNLTLQDATVTGSSGVGAIIGKNDGILTNSHSLKVTTGQISGTTDVGGLVGNNAGTITSSDGSNVAVSGNSNVGGLVGNNAGAITNSYVDSGAVTASVRDIGGLTGNNLGTVTNSHFNIDAVTTNGGNNVTAGGLYDTGGAGQFNSWYNGGSLTPLLITNYSTTLVLQLDGSYGIGTLQGMKDMLGFADDPLAYNFKLTGPVALPPGFYVPKLVGNFNGNNQTLSNLNFTLPNSDVGLFGVTSQKSVVSNLFLTNARVNGYSNVGGLVGNNNGKIDNVNVTIDAVNGVTAVGGQVGGLVGHNFGGSYLTGVPTSTRVFTGVISNSFVSGGLVSSTGDDAGGLVGWNELGGIQNSNGNAVSVSGASNVGGLVGLNEALSYSASLYPNGSISFSTVTNGVVTGTGGSLTSGIGGLVGTNRSTNNINGGGNIDSSGSDLTTVNGGTASGVGGLVGINKGAANSSWTGAGYATIWSGTITNSYVSNGTVSSAGGNVGGLVGYNYTAPIDSSFVDNVIVTGNLNVGGLVGHDGGEGYGGGIGMISNSSALTTQVTGASHVGGLVGLVQAPTSNGSSDNFDAVVSSYVSGGTVTGNGSGAWSTGANGIVNGVGIGGLVGYSDHGNVIGSFVANTNVNGGLVTDVGGLVGHNIGSTYFTVYRGLISNSYVSGGTVIGNNNVGGLVGNNASVGLNDRGFVQSSHVLGTSVSGSWSVGGLVGWNRGDISGSFAENVTLLATTSGSASAGGLVGDNGGSISNSYVSGGTVSASNGTEVGGLVGYNSGSITNSYAEGGTVSASKVVGGLVGFNASAVTSSGACISGGCISNSYVGNGIINSSNTSAATGLAAASAGGLVGTNWGKISNTYVNGGSVSALATDSGWVGGLVGNNYGTVTTSYASTGVIGGGLYGFAGLVGGNNGTGSVAGSFWDVDTTGYTAGIGAGSPLGATGIHSSTIPVDAFTQATYVGFDFTPGTGAWYMVDGNTRPFLQMEYSATITNAHQLQLMGMAATTLAGSYTLANNINLAETATGTGMWGSAGFVPLGTAATPFTGSLVGSNFTIANLNVGTAGDAGLFGAIGSGGSVANIGLINSVVNESGTKAAGALAGTNGGVISNSYVNGGSVTGGISGPVGGLVGYNYGSVNNSYVSGDVVSSNSGPLGGLAGNNNGGSITNSYASNGSLSSVSGQTGGLVGLNSLAGTISNSYWDMALAAAATGNGAGTLTNVTGLTAAQMQQQSSFVGFDFTNTWRIYNGHTAPLLKSFLKQVTVSASGITGNLTKTFDGAPYTPPPLGTLLYSDPLAAGLLNEADPFGAVTQGVAVNVGSYEMFWSGQQGYDIIYTAGGMLTINPAVVTLLSITANNASKTYGTTLAFAGTEFTPVDLINGDTITSVTLTSAGAVNTANAGTYSIDITPGSEVFGQGSAANYTISYLPGTLTVDPLALTVTADPLSKVYGDIDPVLTYTASGLLFSDALTGGLTRVAGQNVGNYAINRGTLANPNYAISYTGANLTITQRPITVSASAASKVYGSADPNLYTVGGGLAAWDSNAAVFTGSLNHSGGENVGAHAITQGTLAANANYSITGFTGNTLTITPALLTVTADTINKVFGTPDPALTYTVAGLQFSDTAAGTVSVSLTRDPGEFIGWYVINGTATLLGSNYTLAPLVPGNFIILPPTVVQEITEISLSTETPEGNARDEKEKEVLASIEGEGDQGGGLPDNLPVCR